MLARLNDVCRVVFPKHFVILMSLLNTYHDNRKKRWANRCFWCKFEYSFTNYSAFQVKQQMAEGEDHINFEMKSKENTTSSGYQVWHPPHFFCLLFLTKHPFALRLNHWPLTWEDKASFSSSQQFPCRGLWPLKGFLNWHSALQGPTARSQVHRAVK